ncbi:glycosyltransferase family 4 protein [Micrococcus endophyticus]|uniref:glycosyltransferase family 4 protein n=1 Tax=Micrococcus endophyticus TaxID=455343 RepID=UPI0034CD3A4A
MPGPEIPEEAAASRGFSAPPTPVEGKEPVDTRCLVLTSGRAADGPYGVDQLRQLGYELMEVEPAAGGVHRKVRDVLEHRSGRPLDKALRSVPLAQQSDVVLAFLEKEALAASWAKQRRLPPYAGRPLVMIACWLADEICTMSSEERAAEVARYRGVDLILVLSRNQVDILVDAGFAADRVEAVTFGYDPGQFPPALFEQRQGIVSVGADRGRDFTTLISAVDGSGLPLHLYTDPGHVQGLRLPPEVVFHGRVSFEHYRKVVATASVVAIPTHKMAYPSGQTVALEAAGTGACLVLTDTPAMREYFTDETAVFVRPGDTEGWRKTLIDLDGDPERRRQLGDKAAALATEHLTYAHMWHQVDGALRQRGWTRRR